MSDIYINGESLRVDKKFDSVLIEGIDEVASSLRPKIVIGGSGGGSGDGIGISHISDTEYYNAFVSVEEPNVTFVSSEILN